MYSVYAILKVEDRYDYSSPQVSVVETSNYEGELMNKLHDYYNEYLEEINNTYSEDVKKEEWYQNMLEQITWNSDGKDFSDTSGYKQFVKYVLVEL